MLSASLDTVWSALVCPHCRSRLSHPTTLGCGHSLCSNHLPISSCPVKDCARPPIFSHREGLEYNTIRQDVTLNKVLALLTKTQDSLDQYSDSGSETDSEDGYTSHDSRELAIPQDSSVAQHTSQIRTPQAPPSSLDSFVRLRPPPVKRHSSSSTTSGNSATHRPPSRKRRRRETSQSATIPGANDVQEDGNDGDLLGHLMRHRDLQRSTPAHMPLPEIPSNLGLPNDPRRASSTAPDTFPRSDSVQLFEKDLLVELMCEICFGVLHHPITTLCQHTFCSKCLHRSLDHSPQCPLCRELLPIHVYFDEHPENSTICTLLTSTVPLLSDAYQARTATVEEEERKARLSMPIFVGQLSLPGMPTLLHFFEPRFRIMLRRCLESPKPMFGMIMPPRSSPPSSMATESTPMQVEYGTMLEIRSVQMLSDGRSMVETWGTWRFRVLERGLLDGYMVGRVERIDDFPEDLVEVFSPTATNGNGVPHGLPKEVYDVTRPPNVRRRSSTGEPLLSPTGPSTIPSTPAEMGRQPRRVMSDPRISVSAPQRSIPLPALTTQELISHCLSFLIALRAGTAPWVSQRLSHAYDFAGLGLDALINESMAVQEPENPGFPIPGPSNPSRTVFPRPSESGSHIDRPAVKPTQAVLSFYIATLLPIDEYEKAKLLPIRSARMRLQLCVWWIEGLRKHWWFERGCVVL